MSTRARTTSTARVSRGRLSRNCREAIEQGKPNEDHHCWGCEGCNCHAGPPSVSLRDLVKAAKEGDQ